MDSRDLCLSHRTGDLGTPQCIPKLALEIKKLTVRILLIDIQTQGRFIVTDGVLTIRQEFC